MTHSWIVFVTESDAPNTGVSIEEAVAHVRELGRDAAEVRAVLGGNAERLLAR